MDALKVSAWQRKIPRPRRAAAKDNCIKLFRKLLGLIVRAHVYSRRKPDAFRGHQIEAPLDHGLLQFHVGNAVHQQPAGPIRAFEDRHQVAGPIELAGASEPCRPRTNYGYLFARAHRRRFRHYPARVESSINDGLLDGLDRHRRIADAEHARSFAGRRANAARELREIVGLVQTIERFTPLTTIDKIIPLRNQVIDWTAGRGTVNDLARMTERHAAVHATGALLAQTRLWYVLMELLPLKHASPRRPRNRNRARVFHEAGSLTHFRFSIANFQFVSFQVLNVRFKFHMTRPASFFSSPSPFGRGLGRGFNDHLRQLPPLPWPFSQREKGESIISHRLATTHAWSNQAPPTLPL